MATRIMTTGMTRHSTTNVQHSHPPAADLVADPVADPPRFFSEADCRALVAHIAVLSNHRGATSLRLNSTWNSSVRWARNRSSTVADSRQTTLQLQRGAGDVTLNQTDTASLTAAVQWAEQMDRLNGNVARIQEFGYAPPDISYPKTHIWSEPTYQMTSDARGTIANALMGKAEQAGMLSAGYLNVGAGSRHLRLGDARMLYARYTTAECSLTVRDPEGTGSGWAGASSYDWAQIDAEKLAAIALDKCLKSRNPVRIEPGRYTVIMEPQATYEMIRQIFEPDAKANYMDWEWEEAFIPGLPSDRPFHDGHKVVPTSRWGPPQDVGVTKIGQRLLDAQLSITFDPTDPQLGVIPFTNAGDAYVPITWWEQGVLKTLAYSRGHGPNPAKLDAQPNPSVFRMNGGTTTIDEMIATTERGLLVTRFWGVKLLDISSILCTGVTRDGLWFIEHGKITHPVKNLRFTESPLFVFNQIEQLGVPVPIFAPGQPAVVPPMKVRDFSFTSMVDAI